MAYVDQNQSKEKMIAAVITAILFAALGYAFYTGLAFNVIKNVAKDMKVIDVTEPPPPPPKKPPPPPKETPKPNTPPPIVAPPPIVQPPRVMAPPIVTVPKAPPAPPPMIVPPAPPAPPAAPPAPPKPSQASGPKPRGNPGDWVTPDDYPPAAERNNEQGVTGFKLDIGPDGRATSCTVTSSSGFPDLDSTACTMLRRRARFSPAKDTAGNAIASTYSSSVRWQIPKE